MSKSFDKILVRRIREVFDNHREPVDPDAWKDMERRLNRQSSLRVVYLKRIAGVAALLLLLLLIFRPFESHRDITSSLDRVVQTESKPESEPGPSSSGQSSESAGSAEAARDRDAMAEADPEARQAQDIEQTRHDPQVRTNSEQMKKIELLSAGIQGPRETEQAGSRDAPPADISLLGSQVDRTEDDDVWADLPVQPAVAKEKNKMALGVEFSTLYNYSSSMIASEVNFAGGVISEFQVIPGLKVSTGLVISRQYFTTRKQSRGLTTYLSENTKIGPATELTRIDGVSASYHDLSNKVKLIGLDVPLNIEYRIENVSFSAGISSFTYLQEKYRHDFTGDYTVYEYDGANNLVGSDNITRSGSVKETYNPLGKLDLANVLNLAVGYHFDVGRTQLVVEPFMKHPLGDLASRDIRFGARGLRIRVGF